jgi:putative ABC transport system permease protein
MLMRMMAFVRGLARRGEIGTEADEELQFHLDREIAANIARGMSAIDARRVALRDLGGLAQTAEAVKEVRRIGLSALGRDVRYGLRALAGSRRFTGAALGTIVLTVGGITTVFTLVHAVLLRPLPYPDATRLAIVKSTEPKGLGTGVALPDVLTFQQESRSFDGWALFRVGYVTTVLDARDNTPDWPVQDMRVTPDLFPLLGIEVVIGRPLLPVDSEPAASDVVVISHDLWQAQFAGEADVLDKTIHIEGKPFTIVGVTARDADVPTNWLTYPIVWRPVREATDGALRFTTIARLRKDVPVTRGSAELVQMAEKLAGEQPATHRHRTTTATLLLDEIVGDYKRVLWLFFGAVLCVLLIGMGNLISLQVTRNGEREREIYLRVALGASRWQIVRQLLIESILLSAVGGAIGFGLAWPAVRLIVSTLPARFPRTDQIAVDAWVALFACGVSLSTGIIVGLVSAWRASHANLTTRLNEGGRSATLSSRRSRLQRALIALETAVALVLLIGAALLANSLQRLISRDAGMTEDNLWAVTVTLPSRYGDDAAQTAFWSSALEHVKGLPGVQSAAVTVNTSGPLSGGDILEGGIVPESRAGASPSRDGLLLSARRVSADYFSTLGIPLLTGRPILQSDTAGAEGVVVLNKLAADAFWPGEDPIGKRLRSRSQFKTVVGVIPTFRHSRLDGELTPQMYTSYLQQPSVSQDTPPHRDPSTSVIMLRTKAGDRHAPSAVKPLLTSLEKDLIVNVATMANVRWKLLAKERFRATVLVVFAASAVCLALVGIFGLVAYSVSQRGREIALRVALGAAPGDIIRVVLREVVTPAFFGLAGGLVVASLATRLLSTLLVEVRATDPPTFVAALALLALAALTAGLVPARRALVVDPVEALRHE